MHFFWLNNPNYHLEKELVLMKRHDPWVPAVAPSLRPGPTHRPRPTVGLPGPHTQAPPHCGAAGSTAAARSFQTCAVLLGWRAVPEAFLGRWLCTSKLIK